MCSRNYANIIRTSKYMGRKAKGRWRVEPNSVEPDSKHSRTGRGTRHRSKADNQIIRQPRARVGSVPHIQRNCLLAVNEHRCWSAQDQRAWWPCRRRLMIYRYRGSVGRAQVQDASGYSAGAGCKQACVLCVLTNETPRNISI